MPAPPSPPPGRGTSPRNRACYANPAMRVSDAERAEVADRLSRHFGDGRLDQEEFDRRLNQAMTAVTQADLAGLFADLPDTDLDGSQAAIADGASRGGPEGGPAGGAAPPSSAAAGAAARTRSSRPGRSRQSCTRVIGVVLVIVVAAAAGHALAQLFLPGLLLAVLALAWLRHESGRQRRRSPDD